MTDVFLAHHDMRQESSLAAERRDRQRTWQDLAGRADAAYEAIWKLSVSHEQSLPLFAKHAQPVKGASPEQEAKNV